MDIYNNKVQGLLEPAGAPHTAKARGSPSYHSNIRCILYYISTIMSVLIKNGITLLWNNIWLVLYMHYIITCVFKRIKRSYFVLTNNLNTWRWKCYQAQDSYSLLRNVVTPWESAFESPIIWISWRWKCYQLNVLILFQGM